MDLRLEIAQQVEKLPPNMQEQVLRFVASLSVSAPVGESGARLRQFASSLDPVSAREMTQTIESDNMSASTQSYVSHELAHFVGQAMKLPDGAPNNPERYALLLRILGDRQPDLRRPREGYLQTSYREEFGPGYTMRSDGQRRLSTNEAIKCTMLCCCDIPAGQIQIHTQKYGSFGIVFPKQFLLRRGATPVYYVPRNASNDTVGIGPRSVGERFDELRMELQRVRVDLEEYVFRFDGPTACLSKLPQPNTPVGHRVLGRFSALQSEFEELVFARTKFFTAGLSEDDRDNYYMEREWRTHKGLSFRLGDIARIFLPPDYCERFHDDVPDYSGKVCEVPPAE